MDNQIFHNKGTDALRVPGFGLPITHRIPRGRPLGAETKRFRHGISDYAGDRMVAREVYMLRLMEVITEKKDWQKKVFDENITAKWSEEATVGNDSLICDKSFQWCIMELKDKARDYEEKLYIETFESANRCIKSDVIVSEELRKNLVQAVQPLFDDRHKDWHPGSDEKVLNLVHPSLYPLVYGRTRVLEQGLVDLKNFEGSVGKGTVIPGEQDISDDNPDAIFREGRLNSNGLWSNKFQWLPAEVEFKGKEGTDVKVTSYINNLHPKWNEDLYGIVEQLLAISIPLWNQVLTTSNDGLFPLRIPVPAGFGAEYDTPQPDWTYNYDLEESIKKTEEFLKLPDNPDYEPDSGDEDDEEEGDWRKDQWGICRTAERKWKKVRKLVHPEPNLEDYEEWKSKCSPTNVKLEDTFRKDGLQVIVKLSSIELTPNKPDYEGGNWHLEGMLNEHIVSTAIYYYDVQNVSTAFFNTRVEAKIDELELNYPQHDHAGLIEVFGTDKMYEQPAVQEIGATSTPQGRLLVFPNTVQHAVSPFSLIDKTKPGHRRFVVLWLVDPHYRTLSTANVPPQQREWWSEQAQRVPWNLPAELTKMVVDQAEDWLMGLKEAKELRLELMAERTVFTETVEQNFETYNLCEH